MRWWGPLRSAVRSRQLQPVETQIGLVQRSAIGRRALCLNGWSLGSWRMPAYLSVSFATVLAGMLTQT